MANSGYVPELDFPSAVKGRISHDGGCVKCVRKRYCTDYYWMVRFGDKFIPEGSGRWCASFSDNPSDKTVPKGEGELYMNWKMNVDGIAAEPYDSGMSDC